MIAKPNFYLLEQELTNLAAVWRLDQTEANIQKYHELYNHMVELGWDQDLDNDSHLPTHLMPRRYHDLRANIHKTAGN